jgi:hypothetical protein
MPTGDAGVSKPAPSPTPLRGPATISLNDLRSGQTLYLSVGDTFRLDESVTGQVLIQDTHVVTRVGGAVVAGSATGTYKALAAGQTQLQVSQSPDCATATPPCLAPATVFVLQITVQ